MQDDNVIKRSVFVLRMFCLLTAGLQILLNIAAFFGDGAVILPLNNGVWTKAFSEFSLLDRLIVFSIEEATTIFWLFVLYQFWSLCSLYSQGLIFTSDNAQKFKSMAYGLIAMSVAETLMTPVEIMFLGYKNILTEMPQYDFTDAIDTNFLTAGILFYLIAKIMGRASLLQEDADLTV